MRSRVALGLLCGAVLAAGVGRAVWVGLWVSGEGVRELAPSGLRAASAQSRVGSDFWGTPRVWTELEVVDARERVLWLVRVDGAYCPWRAAGTLSWEPDSSGVHFACTDEAGAELRLSAPVMPAQRPEPALER